MSYEGVMIEDAMRKNGLVYQTRELLHAVRGSLIRVAQNLYQIKSSGQFENWGDFCQNELDISESFASKLLTVNRVFLLEAGISPEKLEGIDYEKLYAASKLEGTPEEKLAKAQTLTRRELKEEKNEEDIHDHEPITICKRCSLRL